MFQASIRELGRDRELARNVHREGLDLIEPLTPHIIVWQDKMAENPRTQRQYLLPTRLSLENGNVRPLIGRGRRGQCR
jgi:hypothetical protein